MKSRTFPFTERTNEVPLESFIVKNKIDNKTRQIEYDLGMLYHTLNGDNPIDLNDYDFIKNISKEQVKKILEAVTVNIAELYVEHN